MSSCATQPTVDGIPLDTYVQILQAEDTRKWDAAVMAPLLMDSNPQVRSRAAVAAGRIGDPAVIPDLAELLRMESPEDVAAAAAFAVGEIEQAAGADVLLTALKSWKSNAVRAAAIEGLGKIAAATPDIPEDVKQRIGDAIVAMLRELPQSPQPDRHLTLLSLTAALRARPKEGPAAVALFLESPDPRIRADSLNAMARLRGKESLGRIRDMLVHDADPLVRANAARVLGAAEDAIFTEPLAERMNTDSDSRVRVAAIRALAAIAQKSSSEPLLQRGQILIAVEPPAANELLEIATALGRVLADSNNEAAVALLVNLRAKGVNGPEVEAALARIAPGRYLSDPHISDPEATWLQINEIAAGLTEFATRKGANVEAMKAKALTQLRARLQAPQTPANSVPDLLRAFQSFKPPDLRSVAHKYLQSGDVIVRAAAADVLAELPPSADTLQALSAALGPALKDTQNDAALSVVAAFAALKDPAISPSLLEAARDGDHVVRRRAIAALKDRSEGALPRVGAAETRNTREDYVRAAARIGAGKVFEAVLATDKGEITITLSPANAPLTVDNFVRLAEAHYFDGQTFHRVVANFVIQGGDPRADGNGGPGYTIRCEINPMPYEAGTVGMALSGKDTGGSQFFITHSPQPHLDGGYTAFGRVASGQEVVDRIERGDHIRSVTIREREK